MKIIREVRKGLRHLSHNIDMYRKDEITEQMFDMGEDLAAAIDQTMEKDEIIKRAMSLLEKVELQSPDWEHEYKQLINYVHSS